MAESLQSLIVVVRLSLACILSAAGLWLLLREPPRYPDFVTDTSDTLIARARERLRADPGNPYRWADLGDSLAQAGRYDEARDCFRRALRFGPNIPPILMRAANFHLRTGDQQAALPAMLRILDLVTEYDAIVFHYWDHFFPIEQVLSALRGRQRTAKAYFLHLASGHRIRETDLAWRELAGQGKADLEVTIAYAEALLRHGRPQAAVRAWVEWLGPQAGEYPRANLLYNGSFEREPTASPFDWRIRPAPGVEVVRDAGQAQEGRHSLRIRFPGTENLGYSHIAQQTYAPAGRYRLSAWIRAEELTTDQGVLLRVRQADGSGRVLGESEQVRGTAAWRQLAVEFQLAEPALLTVQLCRDPSRKFDSKIRGTVWVDALHLVRRP